MKEMNSKSPLLLIILLIIFGGIIYWLLNSKKTSQPVQVLSPDNYEEGTTVSLYEKIPPEFPKDLILGNLDFKKSTVLRLPSGKINIKAYYESNEGVNLISDRYKFKLLETGWKVVANVEGDRLSNVTASKDGQVLIVTSVKEENNTLITFQYEK